MRRWVLFAFVSLLGQLSVQTSAYAIEFSPADCSKLLTSDGKISITDDEDLAKISQMPQHASAVGRPAAGFIGPQLIGRFVQVQVLFGKGEPGFLQGTIVDSKDEWKTFEFVERATGLKMTMSAEHPELGIRRVELLDDGVPARFYQSIDEIAAMEDKMNAEYRDIAFNNERSRLEGKINKYRKKNGRNLRTTLYDRQAKLAQMEYLLSLNQVEEALAAMREDVDNSKIPAIVIQKNVARKKQIAEMRLKRPGEMDRALLDRMEREIENTLREQGELLAIHYGDFKAYVLRLQQMKENKAKMFSERVAEAAGRVLAQVSVINSSSQLTPELLDLTDEPSLDYVKNAFFMQPYSLIKKLKRDLWAERMTYFWLLFNKITLQDLVRATIDKVTDKLPSWAAMPFNALRRAKRDADARRFELPQIDRIMHLEGGIPEKLEELRKVYYGEYNSNLLRNFSRIKDSEEEGAWTKLLEQAKTADPEFAKLMEEHEELGKTWGGLSKYYHQTQLNMTAAVMTAGGVGSAFLYYKFGAHDTWLWQALDYMIQFIPGM